MFTYAFLAFVALSAFMAFTDWRRAWLLAVLVGTLQDPVRKLTAGAPFYLTGSVVLVYVGILLSSHLRMQAAAADFTRRFSELASAFAVVFASLLLAAANGILTFGVGAWKAPILSLFLYLAPIPAVLFGYAYFDREDRLYTFFKFYSIVTSLALIGSVLEYLRVDSPALGMVSQVGDYIRFLGDLQVRMISGFYRGPDIMGTHAAMLACIGIGMAIRWEMRRSSWPWLVAAAWGFFNTLISGRRKAVYFVAVFAAVLVLRYFKRLNITHLGALVATALALTFVVSRLTSNEETRVYTKATVTTREELTSRLEGGIFDTLEQNGIMGSGLGSATQGVNHVAGRDIQGWQEGGVGKVAAELGLPGMLAVAFFALIAFRLSLTITRLPDHPASPQLMRVILLALIAGHAANFVASAQTYSDPLIVLVASFCAGCFFASVTLDERAPAPEVAAADLAPVTA